MSDRFTGLENDDVISVYDGHVFVGGKTFTVSEFMAAMKLSNKSVLGEVTDERQKWFGEGLECKLLKPGAKSWQRGTVRITLEFCPENLEVVLAESNGSENNNFSPLDDLRKIADKAN